jgi:hypothetical protein
MMKNSNLKSVAIVILEGLFEITGLGGFLAGFFLNINWLMITGGILVVLDNLIDFPLEISKKVLFRAILVVVLAIMIKPWYVGIFWASSVFRVLSIQTSLRKIFSPNGFILTILEHQTELDEKSLSTADKIIICQYCDKKNKVQADKQVEKAMCGNCKQPLQPKKQGANIDEEEFAKVYHV